MESHFAIFLTPDEADGKTATQLAASGLVANSAVEAGAQDMQLGFAHGALEAEQQAIIEHRRMIDAVGIADERVGETAEIKQAVPIGIVAREAGHFEAEHDADMSERDFCSETGEAAALDDAGAGQAEVFVDHDDLLRRPAEHGCLGDQSILTLRGFAIVLDLGGGGLAKIDVSCAAQMRNADLRDVTHRLPPLGWRADRLAR
jgi:hypothetical protein